MSLFCRTGFGYLLVMAACLGPCADSDGQQPVATPGTLDRLHEPILRQDLEVGPAQSCATSNCHAGPRPGVALETARRGSEYQIWIERDPHAQSWRTMCSDESLAIMRRLKIMDGDEIADRVGFDNCLACHNSTKRFNEPRTSSNHPSISNVAIAANSNAFQREGVGCSSCHGPSQNWIHTHFQMDWSSAGATTEGFVEAGDVFVRARMCASCHVGDKDRDMNHDIIAAGHPALRYEFATYHAWQPKHWRDHESADRSRYESQLWLAGQIAAADASLSLLQSRSSNSQTVSQWPELASFDCASCHQSLGLVNDRSTARLSRQAVARYSRWNDAGLRWLIEYRIATSVAVQEDHELLSALDRVVQQAEAKPQPDPIATTRAALEARMALARWFDSEPGYHERSSLCSDRLVGVVAFAAQRPETFTTWESSVQFYLMAVAARESWPGGWSGPLRGIVDRLRLGLSYPELLDASRFPNRSDFAGPTLDRREVTQLGIELAGWLGPVTIEQGSIKLDDDETNAQKMETELDAMLERIELRWKGTAEQRARELAEFNAELDANEKRRNAEEETQPKRTIKSAAELKEELRQKLESRDIDSSENDR